MERSLRGGIALSLPHFGLTIDRIFASQGIWGHCRWLCPYAQHEEKGSLRGRRRSGVQYGSAGRSVHGARRTAVVVRGFPRVDFLQNRSAVSRPSWRRGALGAHQAQTDLQRSLLRVRAYVGGLC